MDCHNFENIETWLLVNYLKEENSFNFHQNKPKNELVEPLKKHIKQRIPILHNLDEAELLWHDLTLSALDNVKWDLIINHFLSEVKDVRESS
ncbi:MAG: hypothetical protein DWQ06_13705 [Calditrichaeota bacterium]|nr:MAG: hypothetical protein DWQ06_13705 [Calditrichota bacterium]